MLAIYKILLCFCFSLKDTFFFIIIAAVCLTRKTQWHASSHLLWNTNISISLKKKQRKDWHIYMGYLKDLEEMCCTTLIYNTCNQIHKIGLISTLYKINKKLKCQKYRSCFNEYTYLLFICFSELKSLSLLPIWAQHHICIF